MPTPSLRRSLLMWGLWGLPVVVVLFLPWCSPGGGGPLAPRGAVAKPGRPVSLFQTRFDMGVTKVS